MRSELWLHAARLLFDTARHAAARYGAGTTASGPRQKGAATATYRGGSPKKWVSQGSRSCTPLVLRQIRQTSDHAANERDWRRSSDRMTTGCGGPDGLR